MEQLYPKKGGLQSFLPCTIGCNGTHQGAIRYLIEPFFVPSGDLRIFPATWGISSSAHGGYSLLLLGFLWRGKSHRSIAGWFSWGYPRCSSWKAPHLLRCSSHVCCHRRLTSQSSAEDLISGRWRRAPSSFNWWTMAMAIINLTDTSPTIYKWWVSPHLCRFSRGFSFDQNVSMEYGVYENPLPKKPESIFKASTCNVSSCNRKIHSLHKYGYPK